MIGPFHVDVPIFLRSVVVCAGCSWEEARHQFYDYKGHRTELPEPKYTGLGAVCLHKGDVYMWVKDLDRASVYFHEMVHVCYALLDACGIGFDEELVAYLMGWLKINLYDRIVDDIDRLEAEPCE